MDEIKEIGVFVLVIAMGIILFIGLCSLASAPLEYLSCEEQSELNTDLEYKWLFWGGGCRVQLPSGLWIRDDYLDEYQKNLLIEGGLFDE